MGILSLDILIIRSPVNMQLSIGLESKYKEKSYFFYISLNSDIEGTDPLKDNLKLLVAKPVDPQN